MLSFIEHLFEFDYHTIESLIEYKENLEEIEEKITDEEYDELIISVDFSSGSNKGRSFKRVGVFYRCFWVCFFGYRQITIWFIYK